MLEAGRQWPNSRRLIGWFAQMMPMWVRVPETATFGDALAAVSVGVARRCSTRCPVCTCSGPERPWAGPADTAADLVAGNRVPRMPFLCETVEAELGGFPGATVSVYSDRPSELSDYTPVVTVAIEPVAGGWRARLLYVAQGHQPDVMRRWLDDTLHLLTVELSQ
jgi:hypothetical protein